MAMFSNGPKRKIYRGGYQENAPEQLEHQCAAANLKAGMAVVRNSAGKWAAAAANAAYFYILNAPMHVDTLTYVSAVDETGFAYVQRSRDVYLMRVAAGVVGPADTPLTMNGDGRLKVATGTDVVIGYLHYAVASAATVDTLVDVRIP